MKVAVKAIPVILFLTVFCNLAYAEDYTQYAQANQALDELQNISNPDNQAVATTEIPAEETPKSIFGDELKSLGITGSVTMDYYNRYVWRGQYLDRDEVLQPGVSLSAKGFTVGYWGNWDLENSDALMSDESDYYVSYAYTFDKLTLTGGHTWYGFRETHTSSKEFFVSLGVAVPLSPVFSFYRDYEDGKDLNTDGSGNYYSLSLSQSIMIEKKYGISLELGSTFGYIDGQWLSGTGEHITPTAGIKIPLTSNVAIIPNVGYNVTFGDLKDPNIGNQEKKFFYGVKSSFTF